MPRSRIVPTRPGMEVEGHPSLARPVHGGVKDMSVVAGPRAGYAVTLSCHARALRTTSVNRDFAEVSEYYPQLSLAFHRRGLAGEGAACGRQPRLCGRRRGFLDSGHSCGGVRAALGSRASDRLDETPFASAAPRSGRSSGPTDRKEALLRKLVPGNGISGSPRQRYRLHPIGFACHVRWSRRTASVIDP